MFLVYVDDKPTEVLQSLTDAKKIAGQHINKNKSVRIELQNSTPEKPIPNKIWNFDYEVNGWRESD